MYIRLKKFYHQVFKKGSSQSIEIHHMFFFVNSITSVDGSADYAKVKKIHPEDRIL